MIMCEKCSKKIGDRTRVKGEPPKSTYDTEIAICVHCGAEFCKQCADAMNKCYCCGKETKWKK